MSLPPIRTVTRSVERSTASSCGPLVPAPFQMPSFGRRAGAAHVRERSRRPPRRDERGVVLVGAGAARRPPDEESGVRRCTSRRAPRSRSPGGSAVRSRRRRRGGDAEEQDTATEGGSQRGGVSSSSDGVAQILRDELHHLSSVDTDSAFLAGSTSLVYRPVGRWRRDLSHMAASPRPRVPETGLAAHPPRYGEGRRVMCRQAMGRRRRRTRWCPSRRRCR